MKRVPLFLLMIGSMALARCRDVASPGEERGTCYPNDTCNAGLVCVRGRCAPSGTPLGSDAGGQDAGPSTDAAQVIDTAPAPDLTTPDLTTPDLTTPDLAPDLPGCTPDESFCRDGNIRRCADDGKASVLLYDCTHKLSHQCAECPDGFVCQAPSMVVKATSTGMLDFDLQSYPGACGDAPYVSATFNVASNAAGDRLFTFSFAPTADERVSLHQHFEIVPGDPYTLRPSALNSGMVIGVSYQKAGQFCMSNYGGSAAVEPPTAGAVTLVFSGKDPGDTFSLSAQGYVSCDLGKSWKPFSLTASGVLTQ